MFEPTITITDANKFSGTGPGESWTFLIKSCQDIRAADEADKAALGVAIGLGTIASGIDVVKTVFNPVPTLLAAGLGWLVEHVGFLRDALDAVTGDPAATLRLSEDLHRAAASLRLTADSLRDAVGNGATSQWSGLAADEFRQTTIDYVGRVDSAAAATDAAGYVVYTTGAVMSGARALFRDLITTVLADIIAVWLLALAFAAMTGGKSILLAMQYGLGRVGLLTADLSARTAEVLAQSARSAARVGALGDVLARVRPRPATLPASLPTSAMRSRPPAGPAMRAAPPPVPPRSPLRPPPPARPAEPSTVPPTRSPSAPPNTSGRAAIPEPRNSAATGPWMKSHEIWLKRTQPEQWKRLKYIEDLIQQRHPAVYRWLRFASDLDSAKEYLGWFGKPVYGLAKELIHIRSSAQRAWGEAQQENPPDSTRP